MPAGNPCIRETGRRRRGRIICLLFGICAGSVQASDPDRLCTKTERGGYWALHQLEELTEACKGGDVVRVIDTGAASVCDMRRPITDGKVVTCVFRGELRGLRRPKD